MYSSVMEHAQKLFGYKATRLRQRFHKKYSVAASGCWEWQRATNSSGYGMIGIHIKNNRFKNQLAHITSFELYFGPIPEDNRVIQTC